jgi:hypothetical protein
MFATIRSIMQKQPGGRIMACKDGFAGVQPAHYCNAMRVLAKWQ